MARETLLLTLGYAVRCFVPLDLRQTARLGLSLSPDSCNVPKLRTSFVGEMGALKWPWTQRSIQPCSCPGKLNGNDSGYRWLRRTLYLRRDTMKDPERCFFEHEVRLIWSRVLGRLRRRSTFGLTFLGPQSVIPDGAFQ